MGRFSLPGNMKQRKAQESLRPAPPSLIVVRLKLEGKKIIQDGLCGVNWWNENLGLYGALGGSICHIYSCFGLCWSCVILFFLCRLTGVLSPLNFIVRVPQSKANQNKTQNLSISTGQLPMSPNLCLMFFIQPCHCVITPGCCLFCGRRHSHSLSHHIPDL